VDRVHVIVHDLGVPFSEQAVGRIGKIDYIVNMASESHVDRSITHPRDFVENNVGLMLTMLEYARENPVEKFIQISTDEVYGAAPPGYDHKEGEPHRPSNPYSASKAAQEDLGIAWWRTFGVPVIQTNTMNIIGEMQDPEKLVPRAIKLALEGGTLPIFADKDGKTPGTRKYLHARNQADALLFILNNVDATVYRNGDEDIVRLNIVGDEEKTNLEMALLAASFTGNELDYELVDFHSARPGHDLRYSLDGSKIAALGWKAPLDFESSVKSTVEWTMDNPEWSL